MTEMSENYADIGDDVKLSTHNGVNHLHDYDINIHLYERTVKYWILC